MFRCYVDASRCPTNHFNAILVISPDSKLTQKTGAAAARKALDSTRYC
jgi:hypothetical protein